jgi:PEGA domain
VSQAQTDLTADPDPLLRFASEPGAEVVSPAAAAPTQSTVAKQVPAYNPPQKLQPSSIARLDRLERSLAQSRAEVEGLKVKVATLVGVIGDIKKRQRRHPLENASLVPGLRWPPAPSSSAMAAIVLAILLGAWIWTNLSSSPDRVTAAPQTTQSKPKEPVKSPITAAATVGPAANVVPAAAIVPPSATSSSTDLPPERTPDRSAERSPARTAERTPPRTPEPSPVRTPEPDSAASRTVNAAGATTYVGTLSIDAEPSGDVYVDRRKIGRTPQNVENLRAGSHLIWIEREGYRRYTSVVQVPANRVSRVSVALEPIAQR